MIVCGYVCHKLIISRNVKTIKIIWTFHEKIDVRESDNQWKTKEKKKEKSDKYKNIDQVAHVKKNK